MTSLLLKLHEDLTALAAGPEHDKVPAARRAHLAQHLESLRSEVSEVVPVLIGQSRSADETAFIRACLLTDSCVDDDEEAVVPVPAQTQPEDLTDNG